MLRRFSSSLTFLWVVVLFAVPLPFLAAYRFGGSGLTPVVGFGILAYTWMLAAIYLATRPAFLDRAVGLPHLYMVHGALTVIALTLAWLHAALGTAFGIATTLGFAALYLMTFLVAYALVFMAGWLSQRVRWVATLKRSLERALKHEVNTKVHLLNLLVVLLVFFHVQFLGFTRQNIPFIVLFDGATLAVLALLVAGWARRSQGSIGATVTSARQVATRTTELTLQLSESQGRGKAYAWEAGDFTFIRFPQVNGMGEWHPFSIVNAPGRDGKLFFDIRADGDFTRGVAKLPAGAVAEVLPSYGRYERMIDEHGDSAPLVMIAGGIGVTPLLSLLAAYVGTGRPIAFLYGARSEADMVYADALRSLAARHANLHLVLKAGGRLEEEQVARVMHPDSVYLIAGPYPMQRGWRKFLLAHGVDADDMYYEPFAM